MTNDPNETETAQPGNAAAHSIGSESTSTASTSTASTSTASTSPASISPDVDLPPADYNQAGVPSLDFVRDKIEGRYGRSLGSTELAQETPEARSFEEQAAKREEAARDRLAEIRRSLRGDAPS